MQIGRGTYMGSVETDFIQGAFEKTESVTDLAVEGDGFFILKESGADGNLFYTRNGQFIIDKDGFLVSTDGLRVQGYVLNPETGQIDYTNETDIQISNALASSSRTRDVELGLNLDADAEVGSIGAYSTTLIVYDSLGREIPLTFTFTRSTQLNTWTVTPSISSDYGSANAGTLVSDETLGAPAGNPFTISQVGLNTSSLNFWDNDGGTPLWTVLRIFICLTGTMMVQQLPLPLPSLSIRRGDWPPSMAELLTPQMLPFLWTLFLPMVPNRLKVLLWTSVRFLNMLHRLLPKSCFRTASGREVSIIWNSPATDSSPVISPMDSLRKSAGWCWDILGA
jgi:hypothetical protein